MTQHVDVLALLKEAQAKPLTDPILAQLGIDLQKSTFAQASSPTSGLTCYDLELGAKSLYPVLTPLRNAIPRVSGKGGIQAAWRAITGINVSGMRIDVSAATAAACRSSPPPTTPPATRASASSRMSSSRPSTPRRASTTCAPSPPVPGSRA
jgi:hypothetical protein